MTWFRGADVSVLLRFILCVKFIEKLNAAFLDHLDIMISPFIMLNFEIPLDSYWLLGWGLLVTIGMLRFLEGFEEGALFFQDLSFTDSWA